MKSKKLFWAAQAAIAFACVPVSLSAMSAGASAGYTGAPNDQGNCASCHGSGNAQGTAQITFPDGLFYTPGTKQKLTVVISDSAKIAWGFQLTARAKNTPTTQAGLFTPNSDGETQVVCSDSTFKHQTFGVNPCPSSQPLQYIEQTALGNYTGQPRTVSYNFAWTPPSSDVGPIVFYLGAVASDGAGNDNEYVAQFQLSVPLPNQPNITAGGVVNGASYQPAVGPGGWVTIQGTNLANSTRQWGSADFAGGSLPTQLDGVSVMIGGVPLYVEYVSPTQVNALAPSTLPLSGNLTVQLINNGLNSFPGSVNTQTLAPALFEWKGKYAVATRTDFSEIGPTDLFPGATTPAKSGDTIILWATGLGSTSPAVKNGTFTPTTGATANVVHLPTVMIGGISAEVVGAALAPGFAGLYQVAVQIPAGLANGDQPVLLQAGSATSASGVYLTIQN